MKIGFDGGEPGYFHHPLHLFKAHSMNTMTNTADFSHTADAGANDFFAKLAKKLVALFLLTGGVNSIDTALLAERIIQD
jgi:hypothetical protein